MELFSEWRAKIPSDALNAEHEAGRTAHTGRLFHLPTALNWNNPETQKQLGFADVLMFQRNVIVKEVWDAMDYWRAIGKLVVVDLDDSYPQLPPSNPAFDYWIRNLPQLNPNPVDSLEEGLRHADAIISPSKVIVQDWSHVVKGYWLPNWTRRAWYEPLTQKPIGAPDVSLTYNEQGQLVVAPRAGTDGQIIIGWGGSISHVDSFVYSGVLDALDTILEKYPQVMFKLCGNENRLDYILNKWKERVIRQEGVKPEHWSSVVSTFDIGIAPLDTRPIEPFGTNSPLASYDERRSWLKAVEYLSAGVPWVGSRSLTYNDLSRYGTLVENTAQAWTDALETKIKYLAQQKADAWNTRRWALRHVTFEPNANRYGDIFGRMIAEKSTKFGARLPGIYYVEQKQQQAVAA